MIMDPDTFGFLKYLDFPRYQNTNMVVLAVVDEGKKRCVFVERSPGSRPSFQTEGEDLLVDSFLVTTCDQISHLQTSRPSA